MLMTGLFGSPLVWKNSWGCKNLSVPILVLNAKVCLIKATGRTGEAEKGAK